MDSGEISKRTTDYHDFPAVIRLAQMPQQLEVRKPQEDWTGLNDPKERRKLQNRLNQRIWRRNQLVKQSKRESEKASVLKAANSRICDSANMTQADGDAEAQVTSDRHENDDIIPDPSATPQFSSALCRMAPEATQQIMSRFETLARQNYLLGSPRVDLLLTLIQFNIFRALMSNNFSLGFDLAWLAEDAISPFYTTSPKLWGSSLPENLRPTELQHEVAHHPWIDLFPIPTMRDNLLRAGASYDDTELCMNIVGIDDKSGQEAGLIVWGDPWDVYAWEASSTFLRKWGWLVEGCYDLLTSTNYWRMRRGEKSIAL